jgi:hypothetical protein
MTPRSRSGGAEREGAKLDEGVLFVLSIGAMVGVVALLVWWVSSPKGSAARRRNVSAKTKKAPGIPNRPFW